MKEILTDKLVISLIFECCFWSSLHCLRIDMMELNLLLTQVYQSQTYQKFVYEPINIIIIIIINIIIIIEVTQDVLQAKRQQESEL